jgi:CO/xanthine dehydrogenase Mo-binding subunit
VLDRMLARAVELSGYHEKRRGLPSGAGIGISVFLHGCAFTGSGERDLIKASVRLRGLADGRVRILAAGVEMGQGLATTLPLVVARELRIPVERVLYDPVDTDEVPDSGPTIASRSIMVVGLLLQRAARQLAASWKPGEEREVREDYRHPPELAWDQATLHGDAYPTYGWGVNAVEVRVDAVTGEVRVEQAWGVYDVGVAIDPLIVEGSAHGGMLQALGLGSIENLELEGGVFRQVTLSDYAIATSLDTPPIHVELVENPSPFGPFGAKGAGEIVADGGAAALAMAVEQAIGRPVRVVPLTPERVLALIETGSVEGPRW